MKVKIGDRKQAQDAKVVGADPSRDLALLKVDAQPDLTPLTLGDSTAVGVGDPRTRSATPSASTTR